MFVGVGNYLIAEINLSDGAIPLGLQILLNLDRIGIFQF